MLLSVSDICSKSFVNIVRQSNRPVIPGWYSSISSKPSFIEPDLLLRHDFDNVSSPVWLVSAPGAVGKSTLAKELCARSGAVYLDLAEAATVAGNYITGGLYKNGLLDDWALGKTTVLVDALDEARLRVTQSSYKDFVEDVYNISRSRGVPVILFGRVGIIEETWLFLEELGLSCPIIDIQHFDHEKSKQFVMSSLLTMKGEKYRGLERLLESSYSVFESSADELLRGLESTSGHDGARFSGYAPVLESIATMLAGVSNPAQLDESKQAAMQQEVIQRIPEEILKRESEKLRAQLQKFPPDVLEKLYGKEEQLDRLSRIVYGVNIPYANQEVPGCLAAEYDKAVGDFISQHPFLDGTGRKPANSVLSAVIQAHSLLSKDPDVVLAAEGFVSGGKWKSNPFLFEFYLEELAKLGEENKVVTPEHVAYLYESLGSRAESGTSIYMNIEGEEGEDYADVEIQVFSNDGGATYEIPELKTSQAGKLYFPRYIRGVFVDAPEIDVRIGSSNAVELFSPVNINVSSVEFDCEEISVARGDSQLADDLSVVQVEAGELKFNALNKVPLVRKGVEFSVSWPGARRFPWTGFSIEKAQFEDTEIDEKTRRLSKIILAFRSHSKGELARLKDKLNHSRMSKGWGGVILEKLKEDGVIREEGRMYVLDPDELRDVVGTSFHEARSRDFNEKALSYLRNA